MLIQLGVNESLAKCHSVAHRIPGSIVVWNGSRYEVDLKSKSSPTNLVPALLACGGAFYGLNARAAWKSGDLGMGILCGLLSLAAAAFVASSLALRQNASDCAVFLNGLLGMENGWRKNKTFQQVVRPRPPVTLLMRIIVTMQMAYPWLFSVVALALPFGPLNMFSSALERWVEISSGSSVSWSAKVVTSVGTALPHFVFWKAFCSQGVMNCVHLLLGSLCQKGLLQFLAVSVHLSSYPFHTHFRFYQSCQLLNTCFSNYYYLVGLLISATLAAIEISLTYLVFGILGGSSNLPLPIKIMAMGTSPTAALVSTMALGEAGHVNTISLSVLTKMMQTDGHQSKLARRQIRSAWPLKVKMGDSNFVEASTALVVLDFTLRRLVDLLLIGGRA